MPTKPLTKSKKAVSADKRAEPAAGRRAPEPDISAIIDFPKEGEEIFAGHYAVRISASPGSDVEISAGGNEWWPCRESVGFYWFDWWPSKPGRATLSVRAKMGKGRWKKASERTCVVLVAGGN